MQPWSIKKTKQNKTTTKNKQTNLKESDGVLCQRTISFSPWSPGILHFLALCAGAPIFIYLFIYLFIRLFCHKNTTKRQEHRS